MGFVTTPAVNSKLFCWQYPIANVLQTNATQGEQIQDLISCFTLYMEVKDLYIVTKLFFKSFIYENYSFLTLQDSNPAGPFYSERLYHYIGSV